MKKILFILAIAFLACEKEDPKYCEIAVQSMNGSRIVYSTENSLDTLHIESGYVFSISYDVNDYIYVETNNINDPMKLFIGDSEIQGVIKRNIKVIEL